jgi:hypothetical protein
MNIDDKDNFTYLQTFPLIKGHKNCGQQQEKDCDASCDGFTRTAFLLHSTTATATKVASAHSTRHAATKAATAHAAAFRESGSTHSTGLTACTSVKSTLGSLPIGRSLSTLGSLPVSSCLVSLIGQPTSRCL